MKFVFINNKKRISFIMFYYVTCCTNNIYSQYDFNLIKLRALIEEYQEQVDDFLMSYIKGFYEEKGLKFNFDENRRIFLAFLNGMSLDTEQPFWVKRVGHNNYKSFINRFRFLQEKIREFLLLSIENSNSLADEIASISSLGINLNFDIDGRAPLLVALKSGKIDIARELISNGADLNFPIGNLSITDIVSTTPNVSDEVLEFIKPDLGDIVQ